jgi:mannose-6-phosphate isomerase-like protein (cupin superfamily)
MRNRILTRAQAGRWPDESARDPIGHIDPTGQVLVSERPWGKFVQFACNTPATVKIITIQPGHRLSLQRHEQRGELWQILDVPIDVTLGNFERTAMPGETVWVPQGAVHRMGNCGEAPGRVLEVAFGLFDEDDIERLDDDYAR